MLVAGILLSAMVILSYFFGDEGSIDVGFYIYMAFAIVMLGYSLSCFFIIVPHTKKTILRYQKEIAELTEKEAVKQNAAYEYLLKNQKKKERI